ncbi:MULTISPECIES: hypothetical protein [unclassified Acidovorax]|uniref:hypothetical protein n=1 Tax=unclassified Acidovorax TaxID=2684926 RepID=UPI000A881B67|nr:MULTISPECIES: hypothetical protein [unclassified Acidovorax]
MKDNIRRHVLACATTLSVVLAGCGGGNGDTAQEGPGAGDVPPLVPMPAMTYSQDAAVCAWMAAHVQPFAWPVQAVGPRTWAPATVQTVDTPMRNAQGLAQYRVTSNLLVLQSHYAPQIQAKGLAQSSSQLWAQEAACKHAISVESQTLTNLSYEFTAYMPDSTAARIAQEDYTAGIRQVRKPDPCRPEVVFPGTPLPPECRTGT